MSCFGYLTYFFRSRLCTASGTYCWKQNQNVRKLVSNRGRFETSFVIAHKMAILNLKTA